MGRQSQILYSAGGFGLFVLFYQTATACTIEADSDIWFSYVESQVCSRFRSTCPIEFELCDRTISLRKAIHLEIKKLIHNTRMQHQYSKGFMQTFGQKQHEKSTEMMGFYSSLLQTHGRVAESNHHHGKERFSRLSRILKDTIKAFSASRSKAKRTESLRYIVRGDVEEWRHAFSHINEYYRKIHEHCFLAEFLKHMKDLHRTFEAIDSKTCS